MDLHDACNMGLVLGLGPYAVAHDHGHVPGRRVHGHAKAPAPAEELSLSLSLAGGPPALGKVDVRKVAAMLEEPVQSSPHSSTVSSYSNHAAHEVFRPSVKRERDVGGEDGEIERNSSRVSDEEEDIAAARKKLRLTKEQSALLEESFKEHTTLNPKQKQALAKQLNLRPRQVEVWFQNRRARTKLKQTEVDCEFLKRCCESLTDENRRLQRELQELKAMKLPSPFYMQLPAATLTMCPSCERVGAGPATPAATATGEVPGKGPFGLGPRPAHFYGHYAAHSSAAC